MTTTVKSSADFPGNGGRTVRAVGTYQIEDLGPYKVAYDKPDGSTGMTSKVVLLRLSGDGTTLRLWVRPTDEMKQLGGKEVVADGKLLLPEGGGDDDMAAPDDGPSLVDITGVKLL